MVRQRTRKRGRVVSGRLDEAGRGVGESLANPFRRDGVPGEAGPEKAATGGESEEKRQSGGLEE